MMYALLPRFIWLSIVLYMSLLLTPKLFPACNTANCNFGTQTSEYCGPAGSCEYPEYCKMAQCQASTCSPPQFGYVNYCVLFSYCNAYPNCNGGCGASPPC